MIWLPHRRSQASASRSFAARFSVGFALIAAHARQSILDVFLFPIERIDLQLHIPLRIDFAGALFQPRDAFRIGIDDHKHRPDHCPA